MSDVTIVVFTLKRKCLTAGVIVLALGILAIGAASSAAAADFECTNSGSPGETCIYEPTGEDIVDDEMEADAVMTAPDHGEEVCRAEVDCEEILESMPDLRNFASVYEIHYVNQYQDCLDQQSP